MVVAVDDPGFNSIHLLFHALNSGWWDRVNMIEVVHNDSDYSRAGTHKIEVSNINVFMQYIQPSIQKTDK